MNAVPWRCMRSHGVRWRCYRVATVLLSFVQRSPRPAFCIFLQRCESHVKTPWCDSGLNEKETDRFRGLNSVVNNTLVSYCCCSSDCPTKDDGFPLFPRSFTITYGLRRPTSAP